MLWNIPYVVVQSSTSVNKSEAATVDTQLKFYAMSSNYLISEEDLILLNCVTDSSINWLLLFDIGK